ncbi:MAG: TetR/AcrR family transcriptional regulator [Planctomycetota bacterium]
MVRYTSEHKAQTRERILGAAARQFREKGFSEASLASIMKEANLTHGGFYAHFESKDHLVAEVIRSGFDHVGEKFDRAFGELEGDDWLRAWATAYMSPGHLHEVRRACPLPLLTPEIARSGPEARTGFTDLSYERMATVMSHIDAPEAEARRRAMAGVSLMVGGMMMARALDEPLSSELLDVTREAAIDALTGSDRDTEDRTERDG